jgi:hypothetical protein
LENNPADLRLRNWLARSDGALNQDSYIIKDAVNPKRFAAKQALKKAT